jgi:8-oxo-dGTP pyrophosphatase MutT (NUDIX family)
MTFDELTARTRERLAAHARRVISDGALVRAAVLVPLVDRGEPCLVFAKRTELVPLHKGQISFPGGRVEAADAGLLATALRESEEEIGLPAGAVEPLGALDDTETVATQYVITPWVGAVRAPVAWRPDGGEIERVIEVPFAALADPSTFRVEHRTRDGLTRPVYFYEWQGETIWGATARIVKQYLDVVLAP